MEESHMSNKHTPGPWLVRDTGEVGTCTELVAIVFPCRSKDERGEFFYEPGEKEENEANARLIAAAPELLEALVALTNKLHGWPMPGLKAEYDAAMAAIAKAEGDLVAMWDAIPAGERSELTKAFSEGFAEQVKGGAQ
jgi:hypothetical protein